MFTYMEINLNDTIRPLSHATYEIISYYVRIRSASERMKQPTNKLPTGYSNFFASFQVFSIEYYAIFHYSSIFTIYLHKTELNKCLTICSVAGRRADVFEVAYE